LNIVILFYQIFFWLFGLFNIEKLSHHAVVDIKIGRGILNLTRKALHQEKNTSGLEDHLDKVIANVSV